MCPALGKQGHTRIGGEMTQTVPGVYDGQIVRLLKPIPIKSVCRVMVTFVEPAAQDQPTSEQNGLERFIGMWSDLTPTEESTFQMVLEERADYFTGRDFKARGEVQR